MIYQAASDRSGPLLDALAGHYLDIIGDRRSFCPDIYLMGAMIGDDAYHFVFAVLFLWVNWISPGTPRLGEEVSSPNVTYVR